MSFGPIDLLFNVVVMLFWFRAWSKDPRQASLNPYLSGIVQFTDPVVGLFRGLFRGLTARQAAFAGVVALILFRGVALPALNPERVRHAWVLRLGFQAISPAATAHSEGMLLFVMFSVLSFAVFLFQVWVFALFFLAGFRQPRPDLLPAEFMDAVARPFSAARGPTRPFLLLGCGVVLSVVMRAAAGGVSAAMPGSVAGGVRVGLQYAISATAGAVDMLLVLRSLLIVLIVGSWISMFAGAQALALLSREWLDFLLGPFRRFPIRVGPLDLTPLIAFFALGIVHSALNQNILPRLYIFLSASVIR